MIDLKNSIIEIDIPQNVNSNKIVNVAEKISDFIKHQKIKAIKILTLKQMFQRLPITLAKVKAGNTSENLLKEIRQTIHSLYQEKEVIKKVYNNVMNSIKLGNRMNTMFVNSRNSKAPDLHRLLLHLSDKINLKWNDRYIALSNLSIYYP